MRSIKTLHLLLLFAIILSACTPQTVVSTPGSSQGGEPRAYPLPTNSISRAYPAPAATSPQGAYPMPDAPTPKPTYPVQLVAFRLDKPVYEGATEVTGSGPAGLPVVLADFTSNGMILGETTIGQDGKFIFKLEIPLEKNRRIGMTIGDLSNTAWKDNDFLTDPVFCGDESMTLPMIAFFFDTVKVLGK